MTRQPNSEAQPMPSHAATVSADILPVRNVRFKLGWIILLIVAALTAIGHFVGIFIQSEPTLFAGLTAFNLYALIVVWIPFRRLQKWAWYATWILPIGMATVAAVENEPSIRVSYAALAVLCALALLVTARDFLARSSNGLTGSRP